MENVMGEHVQSAQQRIMEEFESAIDSELRYEGPLEDANCFKLMFRAESKKAVFKALGVSVCMYNFRFNGDDSILMLFSIPATSKEVGSKHIAERVMEVITNVEECFTTIDYSSSREVKEEKFVYVLVVKRLDSERSL